jgi:DNA repair protein SbcC/Rad50
MIPRKIQIKNFLSYGDDLQTVDFSTYRLICLSGKNGHGKSALLDAMTWALWGQARKSSGNAKADEGLLRLGQDTMVVIFDFELNNVLYRIRREYVHTYGKPYTGLEFGILETANDIFKPLTDKTIRTTQQQIDNTIKLTFDSFINSAFLRQGQSNEFSKKSPKERKDILATILGLNEYDTLRKLAMEKIKQATQEKNTLIALQATLASELTHTESVAQELRDLKHTLMTIEQHKAQLTANKQAIDQQHTQLTQKQHQRALAQFKYTQHEQEQETLRASLRTQFGTWRSVHARARTIHDHQALMTEKKLLATQIHAYQQALHTQLQLKEQSLQLKETVQTIERTYTQHHDSQVQQARITGERLQSDLINYAGGLVAHKQQSSELEKQITKLDNEINSLNAKQAASTLLTQGFAHLEQQFSKRKDYYQKFIAHANWLTSQLRTGAEKTALMHEQENPSCPLCEQTISQERRQFLQHKSDTQELFIKHQLTRLTTVIADLKALLIEQHAHLATLKQEKDLQLQRQVQLEELRKQKTSAQTAHTQLMRNSTQLEAHLNTLQTTHAQQLTVLQVLEKNKQEGINTNELYRETTLKQTAIDASLAAIKYDAADHAMLQTQLSNLEQQLTLHEQFTQDYALQMKRMVDIQTLCATLKKIGHTLAVLRHELDQYATLDDTRAHIQQALINTETQIQEVTAQQHQLLQHKGRLENRLATLTQYRVTHTKNQELIRAIDETTTDYQHIATATGKDGIQALLIEDAIPEIEQEANELLAKLTNNQAQLSIESLRDLKKGGTKETLDIKISDAAGIRAYELFSGGEAFRIDFALRIAISKLLARRAGTALQTLIIDEGFGSQDDEGLTHIMDAMYKIQDDFQKIIIVSHLPAMKDQFPVHFVVEKKPGGSTISVIEHD